MVNSHPIPGLCTKRFTPFPRSSSGLNNLITLFIGCQVNDKDIKDDMYNSQREQLAKLMGGGEVKEDNHRARKRSENREKEVSFC